MSEKVPSISSLKTVSARFSKIKSKGLRKLVILSSSSPSAIVSSAILCRAALKSNILFHVKYMDTIASMKEIKKNIDKKADTLLAVVGIHTYGEILTEKDPILAIGSTFASKLSEIMKSEPEFPASSMAYAFAKETMTVRDDELALAAVGSYLETPSHKTTVQLIKACTKSGSLSPKKGFKMPGINFLPLDEIFLYSIYPYLDSLSGVPSRCQKLFTDADIPLRKRTEPLSQLTPEEATQLTSVLIPRLSASNIPLVLGSDNYELSHEKPEYPLRYITAINALGQVAWSRGKMGLMLGVFIGDRARILGNLVELYREHSRETVEGVQKLNVILNETDTQIQSGGQFLSAPINISDVVLPDVGRIALESNIGNENKFLILRAPQSITVSWTPEIGISQVLVEFLDKNIPISQQSYTSVRVEDHSDQTHAKIIESVRTIIGG
jgi:hypothetical protein